MRVNPRIALSSLAVGFTAYLSVDGLWWNQGVFPWLIVVAVALYLATSVLCVFCERRRAVGEDEPVAAVVGGATPLPGWAAALALVTAVIIPSAVWVAVGTGNETKPFATWTIGAIGALMTIVMVRHRPWIAWIGLAVLAAQSVFWMGVVNTLTLGLVGSLVWVAAAQLIMLGTDRVSRDTVQLTQLQRAASEWLASQSGRQRERRVQVQRALVVAGPVLTRTIAAGGDLDAHERELARLAEGRLRDELRGRRLLDDDVRGALEAARRRGASVTVLDEGGLDQLGEAALQQVRRDLAETLRSAASERIYIRTAPHATVAVTVVGRSRGDGEDAVDLWREIPLPVAAT